MEILTIQHLFKSFNGLCVIQDLNLTVSPHSVFGFIGKNGAGKTTTMKMILGFLEPDSGKITVCGEPVQYGNMKTNRFIGYLPDVPAFYGHMTPAEYLKLCGDISGLSASVISRKTQELLSLVGLESAKRSIKSFSRGMRQRLGIAQALLNEPALLICDEPTSSLDPTGRREILDILKTISSQTTIIFSTHILSDVERICDTVGILNNGTLVLEGPLQTITYAYQNEQFQLSFLNEAVVQTSADFLSALPEVTQVRVQDISISVTTSNIHETEKALFRYLYETGYDICRFERMERSLEQVFMEAIEK